MPAKITDDGLNWVKGKLNDENPYHLHAVGVGDGSSQPMANDSSLDNELYRATTDDSTVSIASTSNTGEIEATIEVSGGNEIPANSDITEFGIFLSDGGTLFYRETDAAVTIGPGDRKTFVIEIDVTDGN